MSFSTALAIPALFVMTFSNLVACVEAAPQQIVPATGNRIVLEDGTPVKIRVSRNLSSADSKAGEQVDFEVLEEIRIGDLIVIPKGGLALGTVTQAQPRGRLGHGGKLDVTIDNVRLTDGEKAALRAVKETKGGGSTGAMTAGIVATSLVVWPAAPFFLFMHGKDITIPKGTEITAYVNGNLDIDRSKFLNIAASNTGSVVPTSNPSVTTSSVLISSTPPGADIEIDGAFVGSTPSIVNISPGDHDISLKRRGFKAWGRKIRATGGSVKIDAELEPSK